MHDEQQPTRNPDRPLKFELRDGHLHIHGYPNAVHLGELSTKAAGQLADFELHRFDLEHCRSAMQLLGKLLKGTDGLDDSWDRTSIQMTLWTGSCVSYCRCFGHGRRNPLDPTKIYANDELGLLVHRHVWSMRNKHYAHDVNDIRQSFVGVALDQAGNNLDIVRAVSVGQEGFEDFQNRLQSGGGGDRVR